MKRDKIFISYREANKESSEIALDLQRFFIEWGRDCELVKYSLSNSHPKQKIRDYLKASKYLLQLFTTDTDISEWMKFERDTFETMLDYEDEKIKFNDRFKVLYTSNTDMNSLAFTDTLALANSGLITLFKIDNEEDAQIFLKSIIFDERCQLEGTGPICLPACCKPKTYSQLPPSKQNIDNPYVRETEDYIHNFRIARNRGLKSVQPDKVALEHLVSRRIQDLKEGDNVSLVGFTLHRYTHPEGNLGPEFIKAIAERNANARLLVLNRNCRAAKERMRIESPLEIKSNKEKALLYKDNLAVETFYNDNAFYDGKVQLRFYSTPYSGVVIFEDLIFVEIYHLGDDGESTEEEKTICGRVPVMVIEKDSPFYRIFSSHFEQLWDSAVATPESCN